MKVNRVRNYLVGWFQNKCKRVDGIFYSVVEICHGHAVFIQSFRTLLPFLHISLDLWEFFRFSGRLLKFWDRDEHWIIHELWGKRQRTALMFSYLKEATQRNIIINLCDRDNFTKQLRNKWFHLGRYQRLNVIFHTRGQRLDQVYIRHHWATCAYKGFSMSFISPVHDLFSVIEINYANAEFKYWSS